MYFRKHLFLLNDNFEPFWNTQAVNPLIHLLYVRRKKGRKKEKMRERKKRRERGREKDILTNVSTRITVVFRYRSKPRTFMRGGLGVTMTFIQLTQRTLSFQTYREVKTTTGISHEEENRTVSWLERIHKPITF